LLPLKIDGALEVSIPVLASAEQSVRLIPSQGETIHVRFGLELFLSFFAKSRGRSLPKKAPIPKHKELQLIRDRGSCVLCIRQTQMKQRKFKENTKAKKKRKK
jgi:hypothetical protein